jgi:O-antigen/teichoic acid export membrane protein
LTASSISSSSVLLSPSRWARWSSLLGRFLLGQLANQAVTLITGLLLIRWLSVEQYARFGVAFAFQSTIALLVDVGFSNSIVALVGHRGSDPEVIGGFIRSAQHFRDRTFIFISVGAIVAFPLVTYRQAWGFETKAWLLAAILCSVFLQRQMMYGSALLIHRKLVPYYAAQLAASGARLLLALLLYELGYLNAIAAAWLATVVIVLNGLLYRHYARPLIREPHHVDRIKPLTPAPCNTRPGGIKFPITIPCPPDHERSAATSHSVVAPK